MQPNQISSLRLANQQITQSKFQTPKQIVEWMGVMQAQDFNMANWAIGIRLPNSTQQTIESAINQGEIIRTHLLRPTWHFVTPQDIHWMTDLSSAHIKSSMKSRDRELELTDSIFRKSNTIIEKSLLGGKHLTREELIEELIKANIPVDNNRASHLFVRAEIDGIICSGKIKANKNTFTLLHEWAPRTRTLNQDEALATLAQRYFTSHGPATLQDFAWWSGLSQSESKHGLEMVKSGFISQTIEDKTYWFPNSSSSSELIKDSIQLIPAYDEFIISYKDRKPSLPFENQSKAVSNNGVFYPIIVVNGQIIGTWKRILKATTVQIEVQFFSTDNRITNNSLLEAAKPFANFLEKKVIIGNQINTKAY